MQRRFDRLAARLSCACAVTVMTAGTAAAQFDSLEVDLLSHLSPSQFNAGDGSGNDCWGYVSPSGREYALMGLERGLSVVEITDPQSPVIVGRVNHPASLWGDVKVYGDKCYVVNESSGGMQIIDLSQVDSGAVTLLGTVAGGPSTSHNIAVDPVSGYLYTCGASNAQGLRAYSLANPASPTPVGSWNNVYVHDAAIVTYPSGPYAGRQIAFCFAGGMGLRIVDVTDKGNMVQLASRGYPGMQYCHQGWPSPDLQYLYVDDELDELNGTTPTTRTLIFDISDLEDPQFVGSFTSNEPASDHNLYTHGTLIYEANYRSGLRIFDATDPLNPVQVAWFDTYPNNNSDGFDGAWSVYPYFPSGNVIVSDIQRGLFVLRPHPELTPLRFAFPNGQPEKLFPTGGTTMRVEVQGVNGGTPEPGTGMLHYDAGGGFVSIPMQPVAPNVYDAVFPAVPCGIAIPYYVSAQATNGAAVTSPTHAPDASYSALAATGVTVILEENFEAPSGWSVNPDGTDDAFLGIWERADPDDTAAQPENDHSQPGTMCWVTGAASAGSVGANDVDGGATTLLSPPLDLSGMTDPQISYWRWFSNNAGAAPNEDVFVVEISNDNGDSWANVETVGPTGPEASGGWFRYQFRVADLVAPSSQVRLRFIASDVGAGSIVEALLDDLAINEVDCGACAGDVNGDQEVDISDLGVLLANFGTPGGALPGDGDLDDDGDVDISDLGVLLANFGAVCS